MASVEIIKAVTATAEVMGMELSIDGARLFCDDLSEYPEHSVLSALKKCRQEVRGKLTLSDVISRIDDGRPGANEAWAMMPRSENESVVWTDEMASAMNSAQPLLDAGDKVAARMAFIEHYEREVTKARREKAKVRWTPSLGHDKFGREAVLQKAVELNRISYDHAVKLLPEGQFKLPQTESPRLNDMRGIASLLPALEGK